MSNNIRTSENPAAGEKIVFVEMCDDNNGRRTIIQAELAPHARGVPVHYHNNVTETFTVTEGELSITLNKEKIILKQGETAHVPLYAHHSFYNASDKPVKFMAEIVPGSRGFEQSLKIVHGLSRDGQCNKKGIPKNISALAVLFVLGEGRIPGAMALLMPLLRLIAKRARKRGVENFLIERYC